MSHEQRGVVSLWVFREGEDPDDVGKDVLKEMAGVESYDLDFQETAVGDLDVPLIDLVRQLSYSESFVRDAIDAAKKMKIDNAYGVLAQYDFAYDPKSVNKPIRKDPTFLGYFNWHKV